MKKFTKFMLSAAAITTVSAAMAISAMAAEVTGTYDAATGVVTISGQAAHGDQTTLLVLKEDAATVTEDVIAQIDQQSSIATFKLPKGLTEGTYYIRVGGSDGKIDKGVLVISGGSEVKKTTIIIGDVDLKGSVNAGDATFLARQQAKFTTNIGKVGEVYQKADDNSNVIIGDVDLKGSVNAGDATFLARQQAKFTTNIGKVGETVEVVEK